MLTQKKGGGINGGKYRGRVLALLRTHQQYNRV